MALGRFNLVCVLVLLALLEYSSGSCHHQRFGSATGSNPGNGCRRRSRGGAGYGGGSRFGGGCGHGGGSGYGSGDFPGVGIGPGNEPSAPGPTIHHQDRFGYRGNIHWTTTWNGNEGKLTCSYVVLQPNGVFAFTNKKVYTIHADDQAIIDRYLAQYAAGNNYPSQSPPRNGRFSTFKIFKRGDSTILKMMFNIYIDGHSVTQRSFEYYLISGDLSEFNSHFSDFHSSVKDVTASVVTTPAITAKINWQDTYDAKGKRTLKCTYTEFLDGAQVFTKSITYPVTTQSEQERDQILDRFKAEMRTLRGHQ